MSLYVWMYLLLIVGYLFLKSVIYQRRVRTIEKMINSMIDRRTKEFDKDIKEMKKTINKIDDDVIIYQ